MNHERERWTWRLPLHAAVAAALAVALVGCGDAGQEGTAGGGEEAGGQATFVAVDIDFDEAPETLAAGSVTIELVNEGALPHNVTVEELDDRTVVETEAGETSTGTVDLDEGSYTYYCAVPGHRDSGMEGTLEVTAAG